MGSNPKIIREGFGAGRLINVIQAIGYNRSGRIEMATVTSEYPDFRIQLDGESIETPDDGITCNPDLFSRTETVRINGEPATIEYPRKLVKGARVFVFVPDHGQLLYVLCLSDE